MDVGGKVISAAVFFNTGLKITFSLKSVSMLWNFQFVGYLKARDCNFDVAIRHSSC